jgi:hypothetical protein
MSFLHTHRFARKSILLGTSAVLLASLAGQSHAQLLPLSFIESGGIFPNLLTTSTSLVVQPPIQKGDLQKAEATQVLPGRLGEVVVPQGRMTPSEIEQAKRNAEILSKYPLQGALTNPPFGLKPCCPPISSALIQSIVRNDADPTDFNKYGIRFKATGLTTYFDTIYQNYAAYIKAFYPAINNVVVGCYITEVDVNTSVPILGANLSDYAYRVYGTSPFISDFTIPQELVANKKYELKFVVMTSGYPQVDVLKECRIRVPRITFMWQVSNLLKPTAPAATDANGFLPGFRIQSDNGQAVATEAMAGSCAPTPEEKTPEKPTETKHIGTEKN